MQLRHLETSQALGHGEAGTLTNYRPESEFLLYRPGVANASSECFLFNVNELGELKGFIAHLKEPQLKPLRMPIKPQETVLQ
jgi:hypothetical protein